MECHDSGGGGGGGEAIIKRAETSGICHFLLNGDIMK